MTKNDRTLVTDVHLTVPEDAPANAGGTASFEAGTAFGDLPVWAQDLLDANPAVWDANHGDTWGVAKDLDTAAVGPGMTVLDEPFTEVEAPHKAGAAKKSTS